MSFVLISEFLFKKKNSPQKKFLILFLLCLLFLLLLFLFCTLFFCFLISLSMIPLLVFALVMFVYSLSCVYLLSLSLSLSLLCFFCSINSFLEKSPSLTFRVFEKILFSFLHPLFVKLFLFYLHCCFAAFFLLLFSIVFVRTRYIDFFCRITTCLNHHKNLFSECLLFAVNKSVIVFLFFVFSEIPFSKTNLNLLNFVESSPQKLLLQHKFFHISFSDHLCVFRKYPSLQLFQKKFVFIISFLFSFHLKISFRKTFEKTVFLSKSHSKKLFLDQETSIISSWLLLQFLKKKRFATFQVSF